MSFFSTRIIRLNRSLWPATVRYALRSFSFPIFCYQPSAKWFLGLLGAPRAHASLRSRIIPPARLCLARRAGSAARSRGPRRKDSTVGCGSSYAGYPLIRHGRVARRRLCGAAAIHRSVYKVRKVTKLRWIASRRNSFRRIAIFPRLIEGAGERRRCRRLFPDYDTPLAVKSTRSRTSELAFTQPRSFYHENCGSHNRS